MSSSGSRILFIDLMRGFAVVIMVMGHSIDSVLSPQVRASDLFRVYDFLRGFTAPVFLFVSGFAFNIATEKHWEAYRRLSRPLAKRLLRIGLLFIVGYALHVPFFSFDKVLHGSTQMEYAQLFQVDVLHCIAATLLGLHLLIFVLPSRKAFADVSLALVFAIALATPFIWSVDFSWLLSPSLAPYFNRQHLSIFPLFPYAIFPLGGVYLAHRYLQALREERVPALCARIAILSAILAVASVLIDLLPFTPYPPHDFWKTSPLILMFRMSIVLSLTGAFFSLRSFPPALARLISTLGRFSLLVYSTHILLVYGSAANPGLAQLIGPSLSFPQATFTGLTVFLFMVLLVYGWNHLRSHYHRPSQYLQAGFASTILILFLIRPY